MSTKSKNPLLKRVTVSITQEIIDSAKPANCHDCYFYHVIKPLIKGELKLYVYVTHYYVEGNRISLSQKVAIFISDGMRGKPLKPQKFNVYIPRKYLK